MKKLLYCGIRIKNNLNLLCFYFLSKFFRNNSYITKGHTKNFKKLFSVQKFKIN